MTKDRTEEQFGDDAVTLQAWDSVKTSRTQDTAIKTVDDKSNIQSSLQELPQTKTTETVCYYHEENKYVHEERRLRIEELDEWQEHKPRTHDKLKLRRKKPDTSPNQLKVGDTVLLDSVDPHIVTTTPNEEIPLTVLSIFPFGIVEVSHPKFGTFKVHYVIIERKEGRGPILKETWGLGSSSVVMMNNDDPGTIHFRLGGLVRGHECTTTQYPHLPPLCWKALATLFQLRPQPLEGLSSPPFPTISPCHIGTHLDWEERKHQRRQHPQHLLFMVHGKCTRDRLYCFRHQTERHRKGMIYIGPYVTCLARHFDLLNIAA
ncbi:hypothetical protein GOBAR_AA27360 [Gossypium barbadense]|uniref:Uncharacterized protein n=1 Tax=Gossypium barbadense TaxID=3634 RepID=A0A2P5WQD0_GOSBA|nr:hypothetical protein GOBAR_AA27360 [Gossypium barbadense]